jgi:hypothetical protein
MSRFVKPNLLLLLAVAFCAATLARAVETPGPSQFIRFLPDGRDGGVLETAETAYRNADGVTVTLIGAVHIADAAYFRGLDASFEHYDALLYEMVKPPEAAPGAKPAARRGGGLAWVGTLQTFMRDQLALAYQLDGIRYEDRFNFVHADLDSETFLRRQEERKEGFFRVFIRAMLRESARMQSPDAAGNRPPQLSLPELMQALRAPDRPRQLKLVLAKQLANLDASMSLFEGADGGSVIITERNKHAMDVLARQIAAGRRNLGVFYGAGHLADMEERLVGMGFGRVGQTWRTAWDLRPPATATTRPS